MTDDELELAYRLRQALNASADRLPPGAAERLAAARRIALARQKPEYAPQTVLQPAGHRRRHVTNHGTSHAGNRFGLLWPLLALALGLALIGQWQIQQRIDDLADVDTAMLIDSLPPSAYVDHGFDNFLHDDDN